MDVLLVVVVVVCINSAHENLIVGAGRPDSCGKQTVIVVLCATTLEYAYYAYYARSLHYYYFLF